MFTIYKIPRSPQLPNTFTTAQEPMKVQVYKKNCKHSTINRSKQQVPHHAHDVRTHFISTSLTSHTQQFKFFFSHLPPTPQVQNITNEQLCIQVTYIQGYYKYAVLYTYNCHIHNLQMLIIINSNKKMKAWEMSIAIKSQLLPWTQCAAFRHLLHSQCYWCIAPKWVPKAEVLSLWKLRHFHGHCIVRYTAKCWLVFVKVFPWYYVHGGRSCNLGHLTVCCCSQL